MSFTLKPYQLDAIKRMHNGCVLAGAVGSGKSLTALCYYYFLCGGRIGDGESTRKPMEHALPLYIITTATKRNKKEWEKEMSFFPDISVGQPIVVDSWNNIGKYESISGSFFIFDEAKERGGKKWARSFIKIARVNRWVLLSATPGDRYIDYAPIFVANGYFRNLSDFKNQCIIYNPYTSYPVIKDYKDTTRLNRLKQRVIVDMDYHHDIAIHKDTIICDDYDVFSYKEILRDRTDPYHDDEPFINASSMCYALRRCTNEAPSRADQVIKILSERKTAIIFYNFDYELYILQEALHDADIPWGELNGHEHSDIPSGLSWAYLVNYAAGAEGWNCIRTNCTIFYSLNYSYSIMEQAAGRINRNNTPYQDLYYYYLRSHSSIDVAILRALDKKKKFNETTFIGKVR